MDTTDTFRLVPISAARWPARLMPLRGHGSFSESFPSSATPPSQLQALVLVSHPFLQLSLGPWSVPPNTALLKPGIPVRTLPRFSSPFLSVSVPLRCLDLGISWPLYFLRICPPPVDFMFVLNSEPRVCHRGHSNLVVLAVLPSDIPSSCTDRASP